MTEIKKNERFIPLKNYIISGVIIIGAILLTFYGFEWYKVIKENKVSTSYLIKEKVISKEITDLDELESVLTEVPKSYFIYISYTGDEEVYEMEQDLTKIIKEYDLTDKFYFINVTSIKDEKDCLDKINKALKLEDVQVKKIPTIVYFNEGEAVYAINKEGKSIMQAGDFQKLLEINNIKK